MADLHTSHCSLLERMGFVEMFLHHDVASALCTLNKHADFGLVVLPFRGQYEPGQTYYRGYFSEAENVAALRQKLASVHPDFLLPGTLEELIKTPNDNEFIAIATAVDETTAMFDVYRLK